MASCPTIAAEKEVSQTPIMIPPPAFEMTNNTTPTFYLYSSMGLMYWDSLGVSYYDHFEPLSTKNSVSTSVDIPYNIHLSPIFDDAHVNLVSHKDA